MNRTYKAELKFIKHDFVLATGTKVDFKATCKADAIEYVDMRPTFECPCPPDTEYSNYREIEITIEECIPQDPELEDYEFTDAEYNEVLDYCKNNIEDFEE